MDPDLLKTLITLVAGGVLSLLGIILNNWQQLKLERERTDRELRLAREAAERAATEAQTVNVAQTYDEALKAASYAPETWGQYLDVDATNRKALLLVAASHPSLSRKDYHEFVEKCIAGKAQPQDVLELMRQDPRLRA